MYRVLYFECMRLLLAQSGRWLKQRRPKKMPETEVERRALTAVLGDLFWFSLATSSSVQRFQAHWHRVRHHGESNNFLDGSRTGCQLHGKIANSRTSVTPVPVAPIVGRTCYDTIPVFGNSITVVISRYVDLLS